MRVIINRVMRPFEERGESEASNPLFEIYLGFPFS